MSEISNAFPKDSQQSSDIGILRKDQHIELCQSNDVEATDRFTGFSKVHFIPNALPEMAFCDTNTTCEFLDRVFSVPLLITGMTGGTAQGEEINQRLALAAQRFDIPMGIGSQRVALEDTKHASIFQVKRFAPKLFLIGNIGAAQILKPNPVDIANRCIDMIDADALAIHLNVIQESLQKEGDQNFHGVLKALERICAKANKPIIVKEVGCGIAVQELKRLKDAGVQAIDLGGRGGTSWGYIEGLRAKDHLELSLPFRDWGIPTAFNLLAARATYKTQNDLTVICTGGIRDGLMVAKACALGANMVGVGLPLFRAALISEEEVCKTLEYFIHGLKIVMLGTGSRRLVDLKNRTALGDYPYQLGG